MALIRKGAWRALLGRTMRLLTWSAIALWVVTAALLGPSFLRGVYWSKSVDNGQRWVTVSVLAQKGSIRLCWMPTIDQPRTDKFVFGSPVGSSVWAPRWFFESGLYVDVTLPLWIPLIAAPMCYGAWKYRGPPRSAGLRPWRRRRVIKWVGFAGTWLLFAGYIISFRSAPACEWRTGRINSGRQVVITCRFDSGAFRFSSDTLPAGTPGTAWTTQWAGEPRWLPRWNGWNAEDVLVIPYWVFLILLAAPTSVAWYRDRAGGVSATACRRCDYDRSGLDPSAACPECGAPGPVQSASA